MRRNTTHTASITLALMALAACEPSPPATATPDTVSTTVAPTTAQPTSTAQPAAPDVAPAAPLTATGPADVAVKASNAFGLALYEHLGGKPGNLAFSPASISVALGMTYAGAKGDTAAQMQQTLQVGPDAKAYHSAWASQLSAWQGHEGAEIAVANRLFGDQRYTFVPAYLSATKTQYGAPLQPVDFAGAPEKQRVMINGWVAKQTHDRIKDLIPPPGVTADTRMALVNAIYFKAQWAEPFNDKATKDDTFTTAGGTEVKTPMMQRTGHARYGEVDGVQLLELGYKGARFATLFVMPPKGKDLAAVESKLDAQRLDGWVAALSGERTWIRMPRFTIKPGAAVELKKPLLSMGMKLPFSRGDADFTGMTNPPLAADRLFIEQVYHKAFVAMDEAGTEAAAATAVMMGRAGGKPAEPKKFHADRPFLFFVRDATTGLVMFAGRVADPTK